jgi:hypothetical protein
MSKSRQFRVTSRNWSQARRVLPSKVLRECIFSKKVEGNDAFVKNQSLQEGRTVEESES